MLVPHYERGRETTREAASGQPNRAAEQSLAHRRDETAGLTVHDTQVAHR
jgi:hypothetical protein